MTKFHLFSQDSVRLDEVSEFNSVMRERNRLNQDFQDSRIFRIRDTAWLRIACRRITEIFI